MSLRFRYALTPIKRHIYPLGGRTVRPRPLVNVSLFGPTMSRVSPALLDTGADDTVFPEALAAQLGLDLTTAPAGSATGVPASGVPLRYASVVLRLSDGRESRQWPAIVGFTPARIVFPMLGFAGCLQFFTSTFRGDQEEVELTVNALYPGT
jgi:hypothetical protein